MDEYIAAYKAYCASTRVKLFTHFYRNMTSVQRFEVNSMLALTLLLIYAGSQLHSAQTAAIITMVLFVMLALYITYYILVRNYHRVYLQLYLDYGEKMELPGNIYIRYLAFIHQIRMHNLYMVDELEKIIGMINMEINSKHISFPLFNTVPRFFVMLLLTLLIGSLVYQYTAVLPIQPVYAWVAIMAVLIFGSGWLAYYLKSIQLHTLKTFCQWAISDIEAEMDFDGVEEIF